ncbi:MerR family transcriptional regulator [uncultured Hoeflea sp.]|uniref:MerR family transcriptional regulator n=1 Tax=uncultured Hoeflea sp. TaxID=538666 RepID=UPI00262553F7|nr:MerR family transcriptional regulator [uncultured Hoeflea sp.]
MDHCQWYENMRIGELARRAAVSRDTIRFYERNGLLRSDVSVDPGNNYRDYPDEAVPTLELIREAQDAGFTIAELKTFLHELVDSPDPDFDGEGFLLSKIADVEATIRKSEKFLRTLRDTLEGLRAAAYKDQ